MGRKYVPTGVMCSEILSLHLQSGEAPESELKVNLEEIWSSGALFQTEVPIRPFTFVWFAVGGYEFRGQVIARELYTGLGYFIEMRFHPSCQWSEQNYRPKHLFNPVEMLTNRIFEAMPYAPISPSDGLFPTTFARTAALASFEQVSR
jgi:hypothetical protein